MRERRWFFFVEAERDEQRARATEDIEQRMPEMQGDRAQRSSEALACGMLSRCVAGETSGPLVFR